MFSLVKKQLSVQSVPLLRASFSSVGFAAFRATEIIFNAPLEKPKKPLSAYLLFCQDQRSNYGHELPTGFGESSKALGQKWRNLSESEKQEWEDKRAAGFEEYKNKYKEYETTLPPKRPITSFFRYASDMRPKIIASNPDISLTECAIKLGEQWKSLSDAEKQKYVDAFSKDKEEYNIAKEEWAAKYGSN